MTVRLLFLVFVFTIVFYKTFKTSFKTSKTENVPRKSIVVVAKEVYLSKRAIPRKYAEMNSLLQDFKRTLRWEDVVEMGDIYARGYFPFLQPDKKVASKCYDIASKCPVQLVRGNAAAKMSAMTSSFMEDEDSAGEKMDTRYGELIVNFSKVHLGRVKQELTKTSIEIRNSKMRKQINNALSQTRRTRPTTRTRTRARQIGGGSQNTHDHGVTSATKSNIKQLKEEFSGFKRTFRQHDEVIEEAMTLCRKFREKDLPEFDHDMYVDAHRVVVSLSTDEYSGTGVSQLQILDLVLWKISLIPEDEIRESVGETLCKRLASGFENGIVVCGTGKVSRIISVFEGVMENVQKGISINLVEQEIAHLAGKVREDFLKSVGPLGRQAYELENSVPEYAEAMSNLLKSRVRQEYVDKLNMEESVVLPLVEVYAKAF